MPIGRDHAAKDAYLKADRDGQAAMVLDASCDASALGGLLRTYQMQSFRDLARARTYSKQTRGDRLRRKSEFFRVLASMADRFPRLARIP